MNRRKFTTLTAVGIAVCAAGAAGLVAVGSTTRGKSSISGSEPSPESLTVRSVVARSEQWPATIEAFGNVVPWEEIIVSAQVEGQPLVELHAHVGDRVRKGQVLARFDSEMLRVEADRLKAEVEQARAEVAQANAERDRALELGDSGGVSEQEVMQRVTAAQVAAARLSASRAELSARELDLKRAEIVAPDDGTISARNAQAGMVGSAGLELFRIIRRDRLEWRGELTAAQLLRVAPGQHVLLSLPDGGTARARVRHIAPATNLQTRLGIVYADVEPGESARAGTYVSGRIVLGERPALVVPASAIVVRDGYSFVLKVGAEGEGQRVQQQRVDIGRRTGREVEIVAGLSEGERVVTRGAGFLDDGERVRVVGETELESPGSGAPQ